MTHPTPPSPPPPAIASHVNEDVNPHCTVDIYAQPPELVNHPHKTPDEGQYNYPILEHLLPLNM